MIFLFKIIEIASSACQISVFTCNQLTTVLFSLAALVEQHSSKLVLHSLVGALTLSINTMTQIEQISCSLNFAFGFVLL